MIIVQSYHNRQLLKDNISLTKVLWSSEHPVNKLIIQLIYSSKIKTTLPLGQIQKYKNTNTNTMDKGDNLKPANSLHVVHCEWEALSCINVSETYVGLKIYKIKEFLVLPMWAVRWWNREAQITCADGCGGHKWRSSDICCTSQASLWNRTENSSSNHLPPSLRLFIFTIDWLFFLEEKKAYFRLLLVATQMSVRFPSPCYIQARQGLCPTEMHISAFLILTKTKSQLGVSALLSLSLLASSQWPVDIYSFKIYALNPTR